MANYSNKRNNQIDGLKGFALLLVMVFHFCFMYCRLYHPEVNYASSSIGGLFSLTGVAIFFIVSGYYMNNDILKKLIRLWPCYFIAISIIYLITRFIPIPNRTIDFRDYLLNIFWINGIIKSPYVDGAHWYIVTLISTSFWASIILKMKNIKYRTILFSFWMICLILLSFCDNPYLSICFNLLGGGYAPVIIAGISLKDINHHKENIVLLLVCYISIDITINIKEIIAVTIALVLFELTLHNKLNIFKNNLLSNIGKASYSIFLIHQNIGYILINTICKMLGFYNITVSIVILVIMIIVGYLFYKYIENPLYSKTVKILKK